MSKKYYKNKTVIIYGNIHLNQTYTNCVSNKYVYIKMSNLTAYFETFFNLYVNMKGILSCFFANFFVSINFD